MTAPPANLPFSPKPRLIPGQLWLLSALAVACALPLILPGDAPWIWDEPQLLQNAAVANSTPAKFLNLIRLPFTILPCGLLGTRGVSYGPASEWFYQLMLAALPHNLVLLIGVRAAIVALVTAAGLLLIARSTGLRPGFAVAIMLCPWLWFYSRQLWDNSLCIPLSALALGAYAKFLDNHSRSAFTVAAICLILLPLVHLMALALVFPVCLHLLLFQTKWLPSIKWHLLTVVAILGFPALPYLCILIYEGHPGMQPGLSPWLGWLFPLLGPHHLSAVGLIGYLGHDWLDHTGRPLRYLVKSSIGASALAYAAGWIGMALSVPRAARVFRRLPTTSVLDHLATLALAIWLFQAILDGWQRIYNLPHYFNATWIAYAIFVWLAVDALPRRGLYRAAVAVSITSSLLVVGFVLLRIHHDGGTRSDEYGVTIANQQQVADAIGRAPQGSIVSMEFDQWQLYPVGLEAIGDLRPAKHAPGPPQQLMVRYRDASSGDAHIELIKSLGNPSPVGPPPPARSH